MDTFDVYVQGIPASADWQSLQKAFNPFGQIARVNMKSKANTNDKFAFVKYVHEDAVEKAVSGMNGHLFCGEVLRVRRAWKTQSHQSIGSPTLSPTKFPGQRGGGQHRTQHTRNVHPQAEEHIALQEFSPPKAHRVTSMESASAPDVLIGLNLQIFVTHVESPCEFWSQFDDVDKTQQLALLTQSLNNYCTSNPPAMTEPSKLEMYGAMFSADSVWYRCQILDQPSQEEVLIRYIDYGNTETLPSCSLVPLSDNLKSAAFSFKCRLDNLQPLCDDNSLIKGIEFLKGLVIDKSLNVTVSGKDHNDVFSVDMIVSLSGQEEVTLSKRVIEEGYAVLGRKGLLATPVLQTAKLHPDAYFSKTATSSHTTLIEDEDFSVQSVNGTATPPLNGELNDYIQNIESANVKLREELEKAQEVHSHALLAAIAHSMELQISNLVDKVNSLRAVRSQVPCESGSPPVIETAIQLSRNDEERVEMDSLTEMAEVTKAAEKFTEAQGAIRKCADKADLPTLVTQRDKARIELSDAINSFLVHVQQRLSLQSRETEVQVALADLKTVFPESAGKLCDPESDMSIGKAIDEYHLWLATTTQEIKNTSEKCAQCSLEFCHALQCLQQHVSLDPFNTMKEELPEFSPLFKDYDSAIDQELEMLKQLSNDKLSGREEVKTLAKCLTITMERELQDIQTLRENMKHYAQLQTAVDLWLLAKPDIGPLQACRKKLRHLRIAFGHKMVEKKELIEEEDTEELKSVDVELANIREMLHQTFLVEEKELVKVANLIEQFPELQIQHPELGLEAYVSSGELLKQGRSIEHFERLEELTCTDQPAFRSTVNKELCVFKEFHLSSPDTLKLIIENAQSLASVQDPGLVSVQAIFKDETNKAYVQLSNYGAVNFTEWMESNSEPEAILSVFVQVLQTLSVMHSKGVFYGSLKPTDIWITAPNNQAILCEFELDRDRTSASSEIDLYNFGKIVLWSVQPKSTLVHDPQGNPRLAKFSLNTDLRSLLEGLLHSNPRLRLSAATAMTHPYFTPSVPHSPPFSPTPPEQTDGDVTAEPSCEEALFSTSLEKEGGPMPPLLHVDYAGY